MKRICYTTLLGLILFHAVFSVVAQQDETLPARHPSDFADDKPKNCYEYALSLDVITQRTDEEKTIIVIARLGSKDLKGNLNKRRLYNIRAYWTEFLSEPIRRDPKTIILAEGEPIKGYGQIEFYVRGELVEILKLIPNGDFPTTQCYILPGEPECAEEKQKLFYPCKDRDRKGTHKRKISIVKRK